MSKLRTEKSRYPSRYSPQKFVTAAQYIVELACERKAKKENKDLPTQFWKLKEWATFYRSQVNTSNSLIKKYGEASVIAALKNKASAWMYSLRAPGFEDIIKQEKKVLANRAKVAQEAVVDFNEHFEGNLKAMDDYRHESKTDKLKDL